MRLKGINQVNKVLNRFLKEYGAKARIGTDFACYPTDKIIEYTFVTTSLADEYFAEFIATRCPDIKADVFLWSFFHELGHIETIWSLTDEEYNNCRAQKEIIDLALEIEVGFDKKDLYFQYFQLEDELRATLWAIDFVQNNSELVADFWQELQMAIMKFYKKNKIEC